MEVKLDITITSDQEVMELSKTVGEGQPVVLEGQDDSDWEMKIVPEEVIQIIDTQDSADECPICGEPVAEVALSNYVGESLNVDRICFEESDLEGQDFTIYHHLQGK
jgi:hypothetical protein